MSLLVRAPGEAPRTHLPTVSSLQLYLDEINAIPRLSPAEEYELGLRVQAGDREAERRFLLANLRLVVSIAKRFSTSDLEILDHIQNGYFGLVKAVQRFDPERGFRFSTYATFWIRQSMNREQEQTARIIRLPAYIEQQLRDLDRATEAWRKVHRTEPPLAYLAAALGVDEEQIELLQSGCEWVLSLDWEGEVNDEEGTALSDRLADPDAERPYEQIDEAGERSVVLREALLSLTVQERTVVSLYFGLGVEALPSYAKIGRRLGISRTRVGQVLTKALAKLRGSPALQSLNGVSLQVTGARDWMDEVEVLHG